MKCSLCHPSQNESVLYSNPLFRLIRSDNKSYPGYLILILHQHVKEMTDLQEQEATTLFSALLLIEKTMRVVLNPDKVNLASLGNLVPHIHWHIIPRFEKDSHFPGSIWGTPTNPSYIVSQALLESEAKLLVVLKEELFKSFGDS